MLNPDRTAMKTHLKAARKMIAMRGGVQALRDVPMLKAGYFALVFYPELMLWMLTDFSATST